MDSCLRRPARAVVDSHTEFASSCLSFRMGNSATRSLSGASDNAGASCVSRCNVAFSAIFCALSDYAHEILYSFCNFNDMRNVFWPSIVPISKPEIMSKGLLLPSVADLSKKDKDEWVLCSVLNEGARRVRACLDAASPYLGSHCMFFVRGCHEKRKPFVS